MVMAAADDTAAAMRDGAAAVDELVARRLRPASERRDPA
jgi:hypothetical protein